MRNWNQLLQKRDEILLELKLSFLQKTRVFCAWRSVAIATVLVFLVFAASRIFFPLYRPALAKDLTVQIVATGTRNEDSLGNNVRISQIMVNGTTLDLSKVVLEGNWAYSPSEDFLYVYEAEGAEQLTLELKDVVSMELSFVSERGAGKVNILVDGVLVDQMDLYCDTTWSTVSTTHDTSPLVHLHWHAEILFLLFVFATAGIYALGLRFPLETDRILTICIKLLIHAFLALILAFSLALIQYQTPDRLVQYLKGVDFVFIEAYLLVFLLLSVLSEMLQRRWIAYCVVSSVLQLLLIISNIKQNARSVPLLPWDFLITDAALSVAQGYDLSISAVSICVLVCNVLVTFSLRQHSGNKSVFRPWQSFAVSAVYAIILVVYIQTTVLCGVWNQVSSSRVYQIGNYYEQNGFLVSFIEYTNYLSPSQAPEGYSLKAMQELNTQIREQIDAQDDEAVSAQVLPDIIVVMSESFWDVTRLENVTFEEDPLPVFHRLQQECTSGELLSHVFGGNTVVSEYEFLTGFQGTFFPSDYMVYGSNLRNGLGSAPRFLAEQGYHTVAVHPYMGTNYNRNDAYKLLGFQQMYFEDDFSEDALRIRSYISDEAMFDEIARISNEHRESSEDPLFLFGITMQNHGGYWESSLYEKMQTDFSAEGCCDSTIGCMKDFFAGLHASDAALDKLISAFRDSQRPTIVIYFGDHMTDIGTKAEKILAFQSWYDHAALDVEVESHRVPYIIWSNMNLQMQNPALMDIGQLFPMVLESAGVDMPYFWSYLAQGREILSAFNYAIAVDTEGREVDLAQLTPEQRTFYENYQLLTYDYVWGEGYASELWKLSDREPD